MGSNLMLHIAGPHLCPVCNIVHDLKQEVKRADELRPFHATFLQVAVDTLITQAINLSANGLGSSAASATVTLTIPNAGHWAIGAYCHATAIGVGSTNGQPNGSCTVGGTAGVSDTQEYYRAANTANNIGSGGYGYVTHGTYTANQTVTFSFTANDLNVTMIGNLWAHFVPTRSQLR